MSSWHKNRFPSVFAIRNPKSCKALKTCGEERCGPVGSPGCRTLELSPCVPHCCRHNRACSPTLRLLTPVPAHPSATLQVPGDRGGAVFVSLIRGPGWPCKPHPLHQTAPEMGGQALRPARPGPFRSQRLLVEEEWTDADAGRAESLSPIPVPGSGAARAICTVPAGSRHSLFPEHAPSSSAMPSGDRWPCLCLPHHTEHDKGDTQSDTLHSFTSRGLQIMRTFTDY